MIIDGERDRPLPERITNPTKEDKEHLEKILEKSIWSDGAFSGLSRYRR